MNSIAQLLRVARAYGKWHNIELSTVSYRCMMDTKKLPALVDGADIQVKRFEAAMQWFSDNWPDGCGWPQGIARPEKTAKQPA